MRVIAKKNSSFTLQCTRGSSNRLDVPQSADSDKIRLGQIVEGDVIPAGTYVTHTSLNPPSQIFLETNGATTTLPNSFSPATQTITFTRTASQMTNNPMLYATNVLSQNKRNFVAITPDDAGTLVLTPLGRSTLANCSITNDDRLITLSSGNTSNLSVGEAIYNVNLPENTRIERILSDTSFVVDKEPISTASSQTVILGMEYENLQTTEGFKIKSYEDSTETGIRINTVNLDTHYLFIMIHSDDFNSHHFTRVKEKLTDDVEGDSFEIENPLGEQILEGTKFTLYSLPIPTSNHPVCIGAGIKNPTHDFHCAKPLFYFFEDHSSEKDGLDFGQLYSIKAVEENFTSNATATLTHVSKFTTIQDFGRDIIDSSKYSLKAKIVDKLVSLDNEVERVYTSNDYNEGAFVFSNFGASTVFNNQPVHTSTVLEDYAVNSRRDADDSMISSSVGSGTNNVLLTGPTRYVHYADSKDKSNLTYNVLDCRLSESFGKKGTISEITIADPYRILPLKLKEGDKLRVRHEVFKGDFNEFKSFNASVATSASGQTYTINTEFDLGSFLNAGEEVRVGSRIFIVNSFGTFNNSTKTQTITFLNENRLETESVFASSSYALEAGAILERRAFSKIDKTLLTDFKTISAREGDIFVKMFSSDFSYSYATATSVDAEKNLITLDLFDSGYYTSTQPMTLYHNGVTQIDYMEGQYAICLEKIDGVIEKIEEFKENGLTQTKIIGRSNVRKLISPLITKDALFSEDMIYSSNSPYNKLTGLGVNINCYFNTNTITTSGSITLAAGDRIHVRYKSGMTAYVGEIATGATGTSFTLVDFSRAHVGQGSTALTGFKEANKNYVFNKALASNTYIDSLTSLDGASNKGLVFKSGNQISSTGVEGSSLIGTSHNTNNNALGYNIDNAKKMKSDSHFQTTLESTDFDVINTLIDFEIVSAESDGSRATNLVIAPYVPLSLGRVDINYANTNDTTYSSENIGDISYDMTMPRRHIEVSSQAVFDGTKTLGDDDFFESKRIIKACSSARHIRGTRNLHGKPIFINGKFLANIIQVNGEHVKQGVYPFNAGTPTLTGLTKTQTDGLSTGMTLQGTNVGVNRIITSITEDSITLNQAPTGTVSFARFENWRYQNVNNFVVRSTRIYLDREVGFETIMSKSVSGSDTLIVESTEKLYVGMKISGTSITAGTTITKINSINSITMSANATGTNRSNRNFFLAQGIQIDKLEGHAKEDVNVLPKATRATKESSKLTHELNLINGSHLHTAKMIGLLHPSLATQNTYNKTLLMNYPLTALQDHDQHCVSSLVKNFNLDGTTDNKDLINKSSQEVFGTSLYRLLNIERGNYNKIIPKIVDVDNVQFYTEKLSRIRYYTSAYKFNRGYYLDGILENNIIGTDITGLSYIGTNQIETFSGSEYIEAATSQTLNSGDGSVSTTASPRVGQMIIANNIPDNTFVKYSSSEFQSPNTEFILTKSGTGNSGGLIAASCFEFDYKRMPESRGFIPATGDRFFEMTTLEKRNNFILALTGTGTTAALPSTLDMGVGYNNYHDGSPPMVLYPPNPTIEVEQIVDDTGTTLDGKITSPFLIKDRFQHIDPKVARMFLFSNADTMPYSSTRKDSLFYQNSERKLINYNIMFLKETKESPHSEIKDSVIGKTKTVNRLDKDYHTSIISSVATDSPDLSSIRRFGIMRLTEVVYDFCFNQFDPENPPSDEILIPKTTFPHYHMFRMLNNQNPTSGNAIFLTDNLSQVMSVLSLNRNPAFFVNAGDLVCDSEGRYIGTIQSTSVGSNITIADINRRGNTDEKSGYKTTITLDEKQLNYPRDAVNNRAGSLPANQRTHPIFFIKEEETQTADASHLTGNAQITGMGKDNEFITLDSSIHLLKSAVMRGLAEVAGTTNPYVHHDGQGGVFDAGGTEELYGGFRDNHSAGYGGDDSNQTDTAFHSAHGFMTGQTILFNGFKAGNGATPSPTNDGIFNFTRDINVWLPINFGYTPNIFQVGRSPNPSERSVYATGAPFPLFMDYMATPTIARDFNTGEDISFSNHAAVRRSSSGGLQSLQDSQGQILQNFKPVFLSRFSIAGGKGAKADIGMTGTRISGTSKMTRTTVSNPQTRVGFAMNKTTSLTNGTTLRHSGFAAMNKEETGFFANDYDNDADGITYGLKPIIKLDVGFELENVTFSSTGTDLAKATLAAPFVIEADGLESAQANNFNNGSQDLIDQKCEVFIVSDETNGGISQLTNSKTPIGTRIRQYTNKQTSTAEYSIKIDKNADASGTKDIIVSRNIMGTQWATCGTKVHVLCLTDSDLKAFGVGHKMYGSLNPSWLTNVDLTGCYLVSEEGSLVWNDTGSVMQNFAPNNGNNSFRSGSHGVFRDRYSTRFSVDGVNPNHILYVLSHEIDTTSKSRQHIITVSGDLPTPILASDAASCVARMNHIQRFRYYRIMQPNHTCFTSGSPNRISINQLSSRYTRKPNTDEYYDKIGHYNIKDSEGTQIHESNNEGILSMYVIVDPDNQSNDGNLVVRNLSNMSDNILKEGQTKMLFSDGDNKNFTSVGFEKKNDVEYYINIENQEELLGVVSCSETISLTIPEQLPFNPKRAIIGTSVDIGYDTDVLINDLMESNGAEFTLSSTETYPHIVSPNFTGTELFTAIEFLMNKKGQRLLENGDSFSIKSDDNMTDSKLALTTKSEDNNIFSYSKTKSQFDLFNDITVLGRFHKAFRQDVSSIDKVGKKSMRVFEDELTSQEEVDKRANELLRLHNGRNFNLRLSVNHNGLSQLKTGDVVTVEIPEENIPRQDFIVLQMQQSLTGTIDLELGNYIKGLEDRFAELAIANRSTNNRVNENIIDGSATQFNFRKFIKIKPIRILVRTVGLTGGVFTLNTNTTTLNTNANALGLGATEITEILEEDF